MQWMLFLESKVFGCIPGVFSDWASSYTFDLRSFSVHFPLLGRYLDRCFSPRKLWEGWSLTGLVSKSTQRVDQCNSFSPTEDLDFVSVISFV